MNSRTRIQVGAGAAAALAAAAFVHQRSWQAERRNPPAGRYRVIAVDRPGYGRSARPRRRWWGPQAQADLIRRMLAQLGVERPILLGHSFGAVVALALALSYPTALRGLVLASGYYYPSGRLDVPLMAPPAIPLIGDLLRHTVSPLIGRLMWPAMLKVMFGPALVPSVMMLRRRYAGLAVPAVLVAGAQDRYVDPESQSARFAAATPGSELLLAPRAGHMVHHSDPRRVFQAIEAVAR